MPLQTLIHRIEGILAILEGHAVEDEIADALFALEDVNARTYMPDYDFETKGRSIVDRAVEEIITKTQKYPPRSEE